MISPYAKSMAASLTKGMKSIWEFGKAFVHVSGIVFDALGRMAKAVGGWKVLLGGAAVLIGGKLILSVVALGRSLVSLGIDSFSLAKDGMTYLAGRLRLINASMVASLKNAIPSFVTGMKLARISVVDFGKNGIAAAVTGSLALKRSLVSTGLAAVTFAKNPIAGSISGVKSLGQAMKNLASGGVSYLVAGFRVLTIAMLTNPLGALVAAIAVAGFLAYKYWDYIEAFASGVIKGFKSAAAPIIEAFKPFQPLFSAIGDAVGSIVNWFGELFTPIDATAEGLKSAASAGEIFGKVLGTAFSVVTSPARYLLKVIEAILSPLDTLKSGLAAISDPMGSLKNVGRFVAGDWLFGADETPEQASGPKKIAQQVEEMGNVVRLEVPTISMPALGMPEESKVVSEKVQEMGQVIQFPESSQATKNNTENQQPQKPLMAAGATITNQYNSSYNVTVNGSGLNEVELERAIGKALLKMKREEKVQQRAALYDYEENAII